MAVGRYAVECVKVDIKHDKTTKLVPYTKEKWQTRGSAYKAQQMYASNSVQQFMLLEKDEPGNSFNEMELYLQLIPFHQSIFFVL